MFRLPLDLLARGAAVPELSFVGFDVLMLSRSRASARRRHRHKRHRWWESNLCYATGTSCTLTHYVQDTDIYTSGLYHRAMHKLIVAL